MTTPFINAKLDDRIEQGSQGGPQYLTTVMELAGGGEMRNAEWQYPRQMWNISYGVADPDDLAEVLSLFKVCLGRAFGFRFKDWSDFIIGNPKTGGAQALPVLGDGATTTFQITKVYSVLGIDGATLYTQTRKITRVVLTTLKVFDNGSLQVEGTDYTADYDTGVVTFAVAPVTGHDIGVYCEFDIPVRFDADYLPLNMIWTGAASVPAINVIELRDTEA